MTENQLHESVARDQTEDFLNFMPGQRLKRARELQGWTREKVAQSMNLSLRFIEAIENDHYDLLPGVTFARGYIRSYARLMQLDENDVVVKFEQAIEVRQSDPVEVHNPMRMLGNFHEHPHWNLSRLSRVLALVVSVCMFAGGFVWAFHETFNPGPAPEVQASVRPVPVAPPAVSAVHGALAVKSSSALPVSTTPLPPVATENTPVVAENNSGTAALALPLDSSGGTPLVIKLSGDAWIRVQDATGAVLAVGMHHAGENLDLAGQAPWHIRLGNAGQVEVLVQGKTLDLSAYTRNNVADLQVRL